MSVEVRCLFTRKDGSAAPYQNHLKDLNSGKFDILAGYTKDGKVLYWGATLPSRAPGTF